MIENAGRLVGWLRNNAPMFVFSLMWRGTIVICVNHNNQAERENNNKKNPPEFLYFREFMGVELGVELSRKY